MKPLFEQLMQLDKAELVEFIVQLQAENRDLDHRIELLANKHSVAGQVALIKKQVQSLKRSQRFISYREAGTFTNEISAMVAAMAELVESKLEAKAVFSLVDSFMQSHGKVYERVDDSSGYIGELYHQGCDLWIKAASQLRQSPNAKRTSLDWQQEVLKRLEDNGYAVWDYLLQNSALLLTDTELKQLAWRFENDMREANLNKQEDKFGLAPIKARLRLEGVAIALQDPDLLEKSMTLYQDEINELQKAHLAKELLDLGFPQRAVTWLQGEWKSFHQSEQLRLLDTCYQAAGDSRALIKLRQDRYQAEPSMANLAALIEVSDPQDVASLQQGAVANAKKIGVFSNRIDTLLKLQAWQEASEQIVTAGDELQTAGYYEPVEWAKQFTKQDFPLAASLCYRMLLDDILSSARSKAYHHGARYLQKLIKLSPDVKDYQGHIDHHYYLEKVKQRHGRKKAFWAKVDASN
ncbi:DUF6880 family protein [Motilimonas eburnea]|uniref:DUF6880 family protein n=1 Tax=Motilimonas eburnea TaxID=1737488 RepID=UPI001E65A7D4|nr:DUF6880 family protein [Motilimonas eburnea]MCE2573304.1 hypothetical protein [Motilimonas eburnea]